MLEKRVRSRDLNAVKGARPEAKPLCDQDGPPPRWRPTPKKARGLLKILLSSIEQYEAGTPRIMEGDLRRLLVRTRVAVKKVFPAGSEEVTQMQELERRFSDLPSSEVVW